MKSFLSKKSVAQVGTSALLFFTAVTPIFAQSNDTTVQINKSQLGGGQNLIKSPSIGGLISFIVGAAIVIAVIVALIFIIIGAFQWITSGGDKGKVEAARNHIVAAIIGLIIIVLSVAILNFVLTLLGVGNIFTGFQLPVLQNQQ